MGDLATPLCLELAKALKRKPRELAEAMVNGLAAADVRAVGDRRRRRLPQLPLRPRRVHRGAHPQRHGAGAADRRARHRRAHEHQSQQGRAHRPPPQRRPRRHLRPLHEVARPSRRDAELHRRHRRAGRGRRRRVPASRAEVAGRGAGDDRRSERCGSTTTAGTFTRRWPRTTPTQSRGAAVAARHAARDREARRRHVRIRVDDRARHREAPHRHDAPPRHHLRPAAERERHHHAPFLGSRVRAAESQRRRRSRRRKANTKTAG